MGIAAGRLVGLVGSGIVARQAIIGLFQPLGIQHFQYPSGRHMQSPAAGSREARAWGCTEEGSDVGLASRVPQLSQKAASGGFGLLQTAQLTAKAWPQAAQNLAVSRFSC